MTMISKFGQKTPMVGEGLKTGQLEHLQEMPGTSFHQNKRGKNQF